MKKEKKKAKCFILSFAISLEAFLKTGNISMLHILIANIITFLIYAVKQKKAIKT